MLADALGPCEKPRVAPYPQQYQQPAVPLHQQYWGAPTTSDERTWAMLAHLSSFVGAIVGPLIVWAIKKDTSKFVAYHALQQLIFDAVLIPIILVLAIVTCGIGGVLIVVPMICHIMGAVRANAGEYHELPLAGAWARKSVYGA